MSEFFVVAAVVPVENEVKGLSHYTIRDFSATSLKKYVELDCSYVWGMKYNKEGLLKLVELTNPIQSDLDGHAVIHKSHKIFNKLGHDLNSIQIAKEQLQECIDIAYTSEKSLNTAQQSMLVAG